MSTKNGQNEASGVFASPVIWPGFDSVTTNVLTNRGSLSFFSFRSCSVAASYSFSCFSNTAQKVGRLAQPLAEFLLLALLRCGREVLHRASPASPAYRPTCRRRRSRPRSRPTRASCPAARRRRCVRVGPFAVDLHRRHFADVGAHRYLEEEQSENRSPADHVADAEELLRRELAVGELGAEEAAPPAPRC